jgi:zinc D-Ala-D-Ala carboxypeptidase
MVRSEWAIRHGIQNSPRPVALANLTDLCVRVLEPLRKFLGKPVTILSGYRNHEVNAAIGGARASQHMAEDGAAADLVVSGMVNEDVVLVIVRLGLPFDQMILEFPPDGWVHVSHGPRNRRETLTATRSAGGTVYANLHVVA